MRLGHRWRGKIDGSVRVALLLSLLSPRLAPAASADTPTLALVIGETAYTAARPLPACAFSARSVAAVLGRRGIATTLRLDASNGTISAALGEFAARLASSPGGAIVYACGYAVSDGGRNFLLPVETTLARSGDAVTEGILARSLVLLPVRAGAKSSLVVLDTEPWPGPGTAAPSWALRDEPSPPGHAIVAAIEDLATTTATPLAGKLAEAMAAPSLDADAIAKSLSTDLAGRAGVTIVAAAGTLPAPLLAASAPRPGPAAPAMVRPAAPAFPDEADTTEAQRRSVQSALRGLGYYDGTVDGIYGPDTRAAMRRYQHELGHAMTGRLDAAEAGHLLDAAR